MLSMRATPTTRTKLLWPPTDGLPNEANTSLTYSNEGHNEHKDVECSVLSVFFFPSLTWCCHTAAGFHEPHTDIQLASWIHPSVNPQTYHLVCKLIQEENTGNAPEGLNVAYFRDPSL